MSKSKWRRFRKWHKYRNAGKVIYIPKTEDLLKLKQMNLRDFIDKKDLTKIYRDVNKLTKEVLK